MSAGLRERLERGELIVYDVCPFPLPCGNELALLLGQRLRRGFKNISYSPTTRRIDGQADSAPESVERLQRLFAAFSASLTAWLADTLPEYAGAWRIEKASFRSEEEAARGLGVKWSNELLHVDAFPGRPTFGRRILRVFANVNPSAARVWNTSDPFPVLLANYGADAGLPSREHGLLERLRRELVRRLRRAPRRSPYDEFMLRLHDYLKRNQVFQQSGVRRSWSFPAGSAWLAFTDTASHAAISGRFALEHTYFVAPETLALPEESPPALLERACGFPVV